MKNLLLSLVALMVSVSSNAMSYEQARQQALFLADKMAYELNLSDEQYEAVYEINLDYLMGVTSQANLYGEIWTRRNLDLSYVLLDWQYRMFCDAAYFYRPLYWADGFWHFHVYSRYPHRNYFYFGRPHFYDVYRGGHSWAHNGGRSWYHGRVFGPHGDVHRPGMRDHFNNGRYGRGGDLNGRPVKGMEHGPNGSHRPDMPGNGAGNRGNGNRGNGHANPGGNSGGNRGSGNANPGTNPGGNRGSGNATPGGNRGSGNRNGGAQQSGSHRTMVGGGLSSSPTPKADRGNSVQRSGATQMNRSTSTTPSRSNSSVSRPSGASRSGGSAGGARSGGGSHSGRR